MFGSRNFLFSRSAGGGNILFTWGRNTFGALGQNNTTNYSSPKQVGSLTTWSQIGSSTQTLAVKSTGELWAWGRNNSGQLGLNDTTNRSSPVQVGALTNWAKPSVGASMSLCIKTDGTLWTWGSGNNGQLGHGNVSGYSSPKQVGSLTNWVIAEVSPQSGFGVLATDTAGRLFAWGNNYQGMSGLGDTVYRSSPVQVGALTNWKTPSCGVYFSLCTKTDGTLWAWGAAGSGRLGLNNTTNYSSPKQVGALTNWATPSGGQYSSLCVKTDGTLWAWGNNQSGKLGLNDTDNRSSPTQVGSLTNWLIPKAQNSGFICFKTDGTLWSWGSNNLGQTGLNDTINRSSPVQIGSSTTWTVPSAGYGNGGCLKQAPTVAPSNVSVPVVTGTAQEGETLTSTTGTWNNDPYSFTFQWQRGTSNIGGATSSTYTAVTADVGSTLRCVVTATNTIGATSANSANTATVTALTQGQLWNWGGGSLGVLGQVNNTTSNSSPVQVGSSTNWTYSAMGQFTALAVNSLGQLWSWGYAAYGQTGHNDTINRSSPTQVGALTTWKKVFNDQQVCCAIKTDGTLWAWGRNSYGNLGDGTTTNRSSPVQITGSTNWVTASQGGAFSGTFAINSLGELWGTGKNLVGQLGLNDITNRSSLTQIPGANWKNVFAGQAVCHAIKTDGTMWGWGANNYSRGSVGDGTVINRSSPVQIGALTTWATLRKGNYYSEAAIKTDGTMWAWGKNQYGQLGQNHTDPRSSPVQVGALTTWVSVTNTGYAGCLARKTDGTLWTWGRNTGGALGIGDTNNRSSPVQIGSLTTWVINGFGGSNSDNASAIKTP